MEPGKLYDYLALVCVGAIVGMWLTINIVTHDLVVNQAKPCAGCAKKIQKEVNNDG